MAKGDIRTYREDDSWKSKVEGSSKAAHVGGTKAEQAAIGRQMAIDRKVEHVITRMDGVGTQTNSYGTDKNPPKG